MKKRITAVLLSVMMVVTLLPAVPCACRIGANA